MTARLPRDLSPSGAVLDPAPPRARREPLLQGVFPPARRASRARRVDGLLAVLAAVVGVVVSLGRHRGDALDDLWAEDAGRFLSQAYTTPLRTALFEPYAAYLHLYPRLAGAVAAAVPVDHAPDVLSTAGALSTALLVLGIVVQLERHVPSRALRLVAAAVVVLLPAGGGDVTANVANAHWWLLLAGVTAAVWRPAGPLGTVWVWAVVVLAVGSDPAAAALGPLLVLRLCGTLRSDPRRRRDLVTDVGAALLWGAVLAVQLVTVARHSADYTTAPPSSRPGPGTFVGLVARQAFGVTLLGRDHARTASTTTLALALSGAAVVVLAALLVRRAAGVLSVLLLALAVVFATVPPYLKWTPLLVSTAPATFLYGQRYTVVPAVLFVVALAVSGSALLERLAAGRARPVATALVVVALCAGIATLYLPTLRTGAARDVSWDAGVHRATETCTLHPARVVRIPVSPHGWAAGVPCARLVGTAR